MENVKVIVRKTKGGPGSGHWGHSGLPGSQGGSAPSGGRFGGGGPKKAAQPTKGVYDSVDAVRKVYGKAEVEGIIKKARNAIMEHNLPSGVKVFEDKNTNPGKLNYFDTDTWLAANMSSRPHVTLVMTVNSRSIENSARKVIQ